jgi:hypothetical protein
VAALYLKWLAGNSQKLAAKFLPSRKTAQNDESYGRITVEGNDTGYHAGYSGTFREGSGIGLYWF